MSLRPPANVAMQVKQAIDLMRQGNMPQAQWLFQQILAFDPYCITALDGLGQLFIQTGQFEQALNCYTRAAVVQPNDPAIQFNCGTALRGMGLYEKALTCFDKAIALNPNFAEAHDGRGNILDELQRHDEALLSYGSAIACNKKFAIAYNNRGLLLNEKFERHEEALSDFNKAISLNPRFAEAHYNRAIVLVAMERYQEALAGYDRAIQLKPGYIEANYNKGILNLLLGNFEKGWPLYEWRWKTDYCKKYFRHFEQSLWLGDHPVEGKRLLLHAEQGYGDTIQFVRYVPLLAQLGAKIILEAQAPLIPLLQTLDTDITLVEKEKEPPPFDLHCPLMSLPLAFRTTVETIPAPPSYLSTDPDLYAKVEEQLGTKIKPRIGLVWSGNPSHLNDSNRSIPLERLKPLFELDYEFHSLHKEVRPEDQALLVQLSQIHTHTDELHDFACTAALVKAMDLVIAVDTSVAHLAGALGKKSWILLPHTPDYRWLLDRDDSPWYPALRLFRQPRKGDWDGAINRVISELQTHALP